jgi:hypothetical protein
LNNDVLSPVCFGALFLCVLQWLRTNIKHSAWTVTGLAIASTYVTKLSNLPLIAVARIIIGARLVAITRRTPRCGVIALVALIVCAAMPIATWTLWTKFHFGDLTGSTAKVALLGWTRKPLGDWWRHPIFTMSGLWVFGRI